MRTRKGALAHGTEYKPDLHFENGGLSLRHQLFVDLYTSIDNDHFANATQCYAQAYGMNKSQLRSAHSCACKLLRDPRVVAAVNERIEDMGYSILNANRQLCRLMNQDADFPTKLGALKEFNRLTGRITDKMQLTGALALGVLDQDTFNASLDALNKSKDPSK